MRLLMVVDSLLESQMNSLKMTRLVGGDNCSLQTDIRLDGRLCDIRSANDELCDTRSANGKL